MPNPDPRIVQGIMISEAAIIVENAFRSVLGMSDAQLATVSADHKFSRYCSQSQLRAIIDYVRANSNGGLPGMQPPRTILNNAFNGISTDSSIRLLIRRVSDFAFYFI